MSLYRTTRAFSTEGTSAAGLASQLEQKTHELAISEWNNAAERRGARAAAEAMREAAAKVAHGFLTGPICPYGNDKPGGPTWDHTEQDICPVCKKNAEESLHFCVQMHSGRIAAAIRELPLPEATPDPREPRGCPTPGACSCVGPDPRDAALTKASTALSAVSADECASHSCRIRPETLAKAREALLTISRLHSWWGAQQIAIEALEATKGTSDGN